jgi:hypothetical protein
MQSIIPYKKDLIAVDKNFRKFIGFEGTHIGSNNWVVTEINRQRVNL